MNKEEIHESWWDGDRNNPSCCEGVGVGYKYQKRITELEEINADLKQSLDWANERESEDVKRIAELEKENKVLAQNLEDTEILNKTYEKRFEDLEKENVELKKQLEMSNKVYNDNLDYSHHIEGQLTKATEIIKKYLAIGVGGKITQNYLDVTKEAEQFISEVEK